MVLSLCREAIIENETLNARQKIGSSQPIALDKLEHLGIDTRRVLMEVAASPNNENQHLFIANGQPLALTYYGPYQQACSP